MLSVTVTRRDDMQMTSPPRMSNTSACWTTWGWKWDDR